MRVFSFCARPGSRSRFCGGSDREPFKPHHVESLSIGSLLYIHWIRFISLWQRAFLVAFTPWLSAAGQLFPSRGARGAAMQPPPDHLPFSTPTTHSNYQIIAALQILSAWLVLSRQSSRKCMLLFHSLFRVVYDI
jgi:hypothetical protein